MRRLLIAVVALLTGHIMVDAIDPSGLALASFLWWRPQYAVSGTDLPNPLDGLNTEVEPEQMFVKFKDIKQSESNVFFVESTCCTEEAVRAHNRSARLVLTPRQSCAVESAARIHPSRTVYLLYTCPLSDNFTLPEDGYDRKLFYYPNVRVVRVNITEVFANILVHDLHDSGLVYHDWRHSVEHSGDLLGVILLWRFGGSYLHLDTVTVKPFTGFKTEFTDEQNCGSLINVEPSGVGHNAMEKLLQFMHTNIRSKRLPRSLKDKFSKMILDECRDDLRELFDDCNLFRMFKSVFYPEVRRDASLLFDQEIGRALVKDLKEASPVVCVWKDVENAKVRVGSEQAYGLLAEEFCPAVYSSCGDTF